MAKKKKFYVVWIGREKGIYDSWDSCKKQVDKFYNAKYMGFFSMDEAKKAITEGYEKYWGLKKTNLKTLTNEQLKLIGSPILNSISVDGAWDTSTLKCEYQGVITKTKEIIFHKGPFEEGTNNTMEYLAIVHALSFCKKHSIDLPIYSDSKIAINWVKKKQMKTNLIETSKNKELFNLLERAKKWINENTYKNKILKWETKAWGENPADFGRK
jgi:ribonuclease HI